MTESTEASHTAGRMSKGVRHPAAMRTALGSDAEPYLERRGQKWHVDLEGLNRQWLLRSGVLPEHIDACGLCTACRPDLFWSHRQMGDARGVQAAIIVRP